MKFIVCILLGSAIAVESFLSLSVTGNATLPGLNFVIDVSRKNALINFGRVKEDGIQGVIHKLTHGAKWKDPKYEKRKKEALEQGLLWGAYHFGTDKSGSLQANHFLKFIEKGETQNMLLALFMEDITKGPEISLNEAEIFAKTIYNETGRYPLIYGSDSLAEMLKGTNTMLFNCPLWIAQYGPRAFVPKHTWINWTLWQYTDGREGPDPRIVYGIGRCGRDSVNDRVFDSVEQMWSRAGI